MTDCYQTNATNRAGHRDCPWTQHGTLWERLLPRLVAGLGRQCCLRRLHPCHQAAGMPSVRPQSAPHQLAVSVSGSWAVNDKQYMIELYPTMCASCQLVHVIILTVKQHIAGHLSQISGSRWCHILLERLGHINNDNLYSTMWSQLPLKELDETTGTTSY